MRVVALFRVSTEKQASEGESLDAQQRSYRDLAIKNGWTTVAEFRGCESATQAATERRVLQQVLTCVRDVQIDALWVIEQSRLSRGDELDVATLMRELKEQNVKIIVGSVVRDLASIDERFMVGIQSLVDRAESERIKERMQRGKRGRALKGKKAGGPAAFGYKNPPPGDPNRGTLVVIPEEAVIVRRIFELCASGKGDQAIAADLNDRGMAASRGGKWGKSSIRRTLENPVYIGTSANRVWVDRDRNRTFRLDLKNPKAIIVENAHEPIIDRELWEAANGRPRLPRTHVPRLLTGLLWVDGDRYGGDWNKGVAFYRGPRGKRGLPWLEAAATDARIWDAFASLATAPEFVEKLLREAQNPKQQQLAAMEVQFLVEQIGKTRRKLDRLVEMRSDNEIDKDTFLAKTDEGKQSIQRMEKDLAEQHAKAAVLDGTHAARIVKAVQVLLAGRTRLTCDQKRAILNSIVRRIDVAVERTGALQQRGEGGRCLPGKIPKYAIKNVSITLALGSPTLAQEREERVGGGYAPTASLAAHGQTALCNGQLDTAFFGCGQVAATGPRTRVGQKGTTFSCWGQPAQAKP